MPASFVKKKQMKTVYGNGFFKAKPSPSSSLGSRNVAQNKTPRNGSQGVPTLGSQRVVMSVQKDRVVGQRRLTSAQPSQHFEIRNAATRETSYQQKVDHFPMARAQRF